MARINVFRSAAIATVLGLGALVSGCTTASANRETGLYAEPMGNAPVTHNDTPYSRALVCLGAYARARNMPSPTFAVGKITDMTGKADINSGTQVTQGASMFAMTALGKAGARLVERYDPTVAEIELKYAATKLLSDTPERAGHDPQNYRRTYAGQVAGSQYYIVGGITELNANIRSVGLNALGGRAATTGAKGTLGRSIYVMNVAIDLRLIDSRSQEAVDMVSYQKQIVGKEVSAGLFDFFNGNIVDLSAGAGGMEPIHLAVRSLVERGVFEFVSNLNGISERQCLDPSLDPLAGPHHG